MKKIPLLLALIFIFYGTFSFSQDRVCDLELTITTNQPNNTAAYGDTLNIMLNIKNNGPDTLRATDTIDVLNMDLLFISSFEGEALAPGDSISYNDIKAWADVNQTINDTVAFCYNILPSTTYENPLNDKDTACVTFILLGNDDVVNIDEMQNKEWTLFPNPASDKINLIIEDLDQSIQANIYDMHGRLVQSHPVNKEKTTIDISTLTKGVYIFKTVIKDRVMTQKILIE